MTHESPRTTRDPIPATKTAGRRLALAIAAGVAGIPLTPVAAAGIEQTTTAATGPTATGGTTPPVDRPYPGTIALAVDATDLDHRVMHVTETLPVAAGPLTLLYPQWLPGTHSPSARLDQMAGLRCFDGTVDGRPIAWTRDPAKVWAFRVDVPAGTTSLACRFDFLSPLAGGQAREVMTPAIVGVQWNQVLLYPASYPAERIAFKARLTLPAGFTYATALEDDGAAPRAARTADGPIDFRAVDLATLVDSPLFAGRHAKTFDLDAGARVPVRLNVFADREASLDASPEAIDAHRRLVQQADRLFGSRHYAHYDFLFALSDSFGGIGLEHHQSSENGLAPNYFSEWKTAVASRSLLPHEYTHSWNGKFRRPADLTTPNYDVPMQDSLLWVYEGQTDYWGNVLAARSGIVDAQTARDVFASIAATYDARAGRAWRNLQDTTNQPIVANHGGSEWGDWVRGYDYYPEMDLVWLDVDTKIRELSNGKRSLDDFARAFFGIDDGRVDVVTYTFDDLVAALEKVQPYDWRSLLRARLDGHGPGAPLDGLARAGWTLVFDDHESDYLKALHAARKVEGFADSLGFDVSTDNGGGRIVDVRWHGPAFEAGVAPRATLVAVNGRVYTAPLLREAIGANRDGAHPLELLIKDGDFYRTAKLDYRAGLRYPHLARIDGAPDRLSQILAPRK